MRKAKSSLLQPRADQAIKWLEKACSGSPAVWYVHAWLAAYAHKEDRNHARAELATAMALQGSGFERGTIAERFVAPEIRTRFEATILTGPRRSLGLARKMSVGPWGPWSCSARLVSGRLVGELDYCRRRRSNFGATPLTLISATTEGPLSP